jgi:hypothetical protein
MNPTVSRKNRPALESTGLYAQAKEHFDDFRFYHVYRNVQVDTRNGLTNVRVPVGTVCIGHHKGALYCRGISICSVDETFDKYEGRRRALIRLVKSISCPESEEMTCWNHRSEKSLHDVGTRSVTRFAKGLEAMGSVPFRWKSQFNVALTAVEKKILKEKESAKA